MDLNFKNWLESNQNIQYAGFWRDGTVIVYINQTRYVFVTDAVYHEKWKKMVRYQPFRVLNDIKNQIKHGHAQQIEPNPTPAPTEPAVQPKISPETPKNQQKTLF